MKRAKNELKKHKIFGRPRVAEEEKRSVKVSVFLTEAEAKLLKKTCDELKISTPEFLRRVGLNKKLETRKSVFDATTLEELRAAGQNLNQTARELSRARANLLPVNFQEFGMVLQRQLEILYALKTKIINHN